MATYYVNTAIGSNANTVVQAQTSSTPWKTISAIFTSGSAGNTYYVVSGSYCEDNGSGRALWNVSFSPPINVIALSGSVQVSGSYHATDNLIIGGYGVNFNGLQFINSNNTQNTTIRTTGVPNSYSFSSCTFSLDSKNRSGSGTDSNCFSIGGGTGYIFNNCIFNNINTNPNEYEIQLIFSTGSGLLSASINGCNFYGNSSSGKLFAIKAVTSSLQISSCSFYTYGGAIGGTAIAGLNSKLNFVGCRSSGSSQDIVLNNYSTCSISNCSFDARGGNSTPLNVSQCNLTLQNSSFIGTYYGASIGLDGYDTSYYVTGTINNCIFTSVSSSGHSLLIGSGVNGMIIGGCNINENSGGYGIVLKNCINTTIQHCTIYGGCLSAVYFKASSYTTMSNCNIICNGEIPPSVGSIEIAIDSSTGNIPHNNQFTNNTITLNGLAKYYSIGGDVSGSIFDNNWVYINNNNNLGNIFATTISSSSQIASAWSASYSGSTNDSNTWFIYPTNKQVSVYWT